jgi:hypothetical protein
LWRNIVLIANYFFNKVDSIKMTGLISGVKCGLLDSHYMNGRVEMWRGGLSRVEIVEILKFSPRTLVATGMQYSR